MPASVVIHNYDILQGLRRNVLDGNVGLTFCAQLPEVSTYRLRSSEIFVAAGNPKTPTSYDR